MDKKSARKIAEEMNTLEKVLLRIENEALQGRCYMISNLNKGVPEELIKLGFEVERINFMFYPNEYKVIW